MKQDWLVGWVSGYPLEVMNPILLFSPGFSSKCKNPGCLGVLKKCSHLQPSDRLSSELGVVAAKGSARGEETSVLWGLGKRSRKSLWLAGKASVCFPRGGDAPKGETLGGRDVERHGSKRDSKKHGVQKREIREQLKGQHVIIHRIVCLKWKCKLGDKNQINSKIYGGIGRSFNLEAKPLKEKNSLF